MGATLVMVPSEPVIRAIAIRQSLRPALVSARDLIARIVSLDARISSQVRVAGLSIPRAASSVPIKGLDGELTHFSGRKKNWVRFLSYLSFRALLQSATRNVSGSSNAI